MTAPEYVVLAFIAFTVAVCACAFVGALPWGWLADRIDAWSQRRVDRMVEEALAATDPAACIAADVLDRAPRQRADDAAWRSIEDAVDIVRLPNAGGAA